MSRFEAYPEWGSILYHIEPPDLKPETLGRITDDGYVIKQEFHITVVGSEIGKALDGQSLEQVAEYLSWLPEPAYDYDKRLYAVCKPKDVSGKIEPRESLVVPVRSCELLGSVATADVLCGQNLPLPFPHVTIATRPDTPIAARGIGVSTRAEWEQLKPQVYAEDWRQSTSSTDKS